MYDLFGYIFLCHLLNSLMFFTSFRAKRLEKILDTPARIYYKYEGVSPAGSHKPNTAVPQVYYNAQEGTKNVVTETGAGQWGSSLAFACSLFGLNCEVGQFKASHRSCIHFCPFK